MARIQLRERFHVEQEWPMVRIGGGLVIQGGWSGLSEMATYPGDNTCIVRGFRLDAVVDESHHGYARGHANLIAGLRLHVAIGNRSYGPFTFVNGLVLVDADAPDVDLPAMRHGVFFPEHDYQISPRMGWSASLTYDGEPTPVAFMRVVALGLGRRDIQ